MNVVQFNGKTIIFLAAILIFLFSIPLDGKKKSPMNIERLIHESGMIFEGEVIKISSAEKDIEMNVVATFYTFLVHTPFYGVDSDTVEIKQYGGEANGREFYPEGVPRYVKGERVIVFLYPKSKAQLTSAVGKSFGKFSVFSDSLGTLFVKNDIENKELFKKMKHSELLNDPKWYSVNDSKALLHSKFTEIVKKIVEKVKS